MSDQAPGSGTTRYPVLNTECDLCVDSNNCIAVADNGTILATTNGGTTWASEPSPTTQTLRAVSCLIFPSCAAVGDQGTILTTTNGCASWTNRASGTKTSLSGVSYDAAAAVVVGPSTILWSSDGGATWSQRPAPPQSGNLNGVNCQCITSSPWTSASQSPAAQARFSRATTPDSPGPTPSSRHPTGLLGQSVVPA